ncbi:hypothetical protein QEZ47_16025 [Aminobacter anthyllidis]|uniref:hypothetical protein n=1 Tax=Aminobacter anthyllidis TaxID=1035067 RepID=UPI0024575F15|nr:hypothetical protein [Aminobacter anthyllidis]MDH4987002.1 hypothetical protein [Aminobacter anthyllidis]
MMQPKSGSDWQQRIDGTILFRQSYRSPTYVLSEDQLRRLRSVKRLEWIVALVSILPVAIALLAWWKGHVDASPPIALAIAYAAFNHVLQKRQSRQRQRILERATLSADQLERPTPPYDVVANVFTGLSQLHLALLMIFPAAGILSSVLSLSMTIGLLGHPDVRPMHPAIAFLMLALFGPLLALIAWQVQKNTSRNIRKG